MSESNSLPVKCNHLTDKKKRGVNQHGFMDVSTVREPCGYTLFFLEHGMVSITCKRCRKIVKVDLSKLLTKLDFDRLLRNVEGK